jgi:hypothetical protein
LPGRITIVGCGIWLPESGFPWPEFARANIPSNGVRSTKHHAG